MGASGLSGSAHEWREAADLLALDALPKVGPATVKALVTAFGSAASALAARFEDFAAVAGPEAARARGGAGRREAEQGVLHALREGIDVVPWGASRYPSSLWHLADPPPVLFLRGRVSLLDRPSIAVVGARRATARGRDVSERLGRELGKAGAVVVSGLALGIDGAAHLGALSVGGDTVAVLGTGADVVYPRSHRRLFGSIAQRGLLVSEFPPGTPAAPYNFPRRNRILAALAGCVVVVEAGGRSGALITVDHALDLGRDVWAVPGPIDCETCVGSNRLLAEGARPLVALRDFVAAVVPGDDAERASGETHAPRAPIGSEADAPRAGGPAGPSLESGVLHALRESGSLVDEVARQVGLPVETTLALLTTLELHGEVERLPGMRFRRAA